MILLLSQAGTSSPPSNLDTDHNGKRDPGGYGAIGFTPTTTYHTAKETISNKLGHRRGKVTKVDADLEDGL